jgi:hypothetical protein
MAPGLQPETPGHEADYRAEAHRFFIFPLSYFSAARPLAKPCLFLPQHDKTIAPGKRVATGRSLCKIIRKFSTETKFMRRDL